MRSGIDDDTATRLSQRHLKGTPTAGVCLISVERDLRYDRNGRSPVKGYSPARDLVTCRVPPAVAEREVGLAALAALRGAIWPLPEDHDHLQGNVGIRDRVDALGILRTRPRYP